MRDPKPGEKWMYCGENHGKGNIAVVLGVGAGIHHEGSHIATRVWFKWQGKNSTENSWHRTDFVAHFCPCENELAVCREADFCKQLIGTLRTRLDALGV